MSLIAYLTAGKHNSSAWLRDRLITESWRAHARPSDIGVPVEYHPHGERFEHPALDPVLRFHCRVEEPGEE